MAFIALELADRPGSLTEACARSIIEALASNPTDAIRRRWFVAGTSHQGIDGPTTGLQDVTARMAPTDSVPIITAALTRETDGNVRGFLAKSLVDVATRMEPANGAQVLSDALPFAKDAYQEDGGESEPEIISGRAGLAGRADGACRRVAGIVQALARETDANARSVHGIGTRVWRANGPSRGAASRSGAKDTAEALGRETDRDLARLSNSGHRRCEWRAGWTRPRPRICGQAARTLAEALGRETDACARPSLASALSEVAGRMDPTEAARICGQAAKTLAEALGRETDADACSYLASALSKCGGPDGPGRGRQDTPRSTRPNDGCRCPLLLMDA